MMHVPRWALSTGILLVLAAFFRFCLRGYAYTAYTLCFFAALIVLHRFLSPVLWRVLTVLVCIGFAYFIAVEIPIIKNARTDENPERPYLIVLGAAVHGDHPSLSLVHRLRGVQDYMEAYPDTIAIVSGGQGKGENKTEAQAMQEWLVSHGIDENRILIEDKATSTQENLRYSLELIEGNTGSRPGTVGIISSEYHLYRAGLMAQAQNVKPVLIPANTTWLSLRINYYMREIVGVWYYWIFRN